MGLFFLDGSETSHLSLSVSHRESPNDEYVLLSSDRINSPSSYDYCPATGMDIGTRGMMVPPITNKIIHQPKFLSVNGATTTKELIDPITKGSPESSRNATYISSV